MEKLVKENNYTVSAKVMQCGQIISKADCLSVKKICVQTLLYCIVLTVPKVYGVYCSHRILCLVKVKFNNR